VALVPVAAPAPAGRRRRGDRYTFDRPHGPLRSPCTPTAPRSPSGAMWAAVQPREGTTTCPSSR
jgi:hypothetical protein